ncbi:hypothetical protein [Brevibacterium sp. ZH18]|uniref:hypothetical protein n=1 Tax=Brevibacterium sp. ZH18 TaxID=2927784 RepID=UPI001F625E9D|nr:hypothetical protein [Brevibacterium sp. ZH18]MCI4013020.1 hypothetical protein [Brevibacterium sp. ZH18]
MDLRALTDEELEAHRIDVLTEQERRAKINAIPEQITALRDQYLEAGGDPAALED